MTILNCGKWLELNRITMIRTHTFSHFLVIREEEKKSSFISNNPINSLSSAPLCHNIIRKFGWIKKNAARWANEAWKTWKSSNFFLNWNVEMKTQYLYNARLHDCKNSDSFLLLLYWIKDYSIDKWRRKEMERKARE